LVDVGGKVPYTKNHLPREAAGVCRTLPRIAGGLKTVVSVVQKLLAEGGEVLEAND